MVFQLSYDLSMRSSTNLFTFSNFFTILISAYLSKLNPLKHLIYLERADMTWIFHKYSYLLWLIFVINWTKVISNSLKASEPNPPMTSTYYLVILNGALSKEIPPGFYWKIKARSIWKIVPSYRIIIFALFLSFKSNIN